MRHEPEDYYAYRRVIETTDEAEFEALSTHHCRFVRARVASRTTNARLQQILAGDSDPGVVANVVDNRSVSEELVNAIATSALFGNEQWQTVRYMLRVSTLTLPHLRHRLEERVTAHPNERKAG